MQQWECFQKKKKKTKKDKIPPSPAPAASPITPADAGFVVSRMLVWVSTNSFSHAENFMESAGTWESVPLVGVAPDPIDQESSQ